MMWFNYRLRAIACILVERLFQKVWMTTIASDGRAFLKFASGSALLVSFAGISACSRQEHAATPAPDAAPATPVSSATHAPTGNLPHLDPGDPVAKSLGYHQDSSTIDAAKFPRHIPGQACRKCVQFESGANDAWGPCTIFVRKQVNANRWCTAFAARARSVTGATGAVLVIRQDFRGEKDAR
jgi:hypothetical protein